MHYRHLLSAPHRILAARCEQKTCVAHQYSVVKELCWNPLWLENLASAESHYRTFRQFAPRAVPARSANCRINPQRVARAFLRRALQRLVGLGRVELPTSPLSGVRSSHLSYRPIFRQRSGPAMRPNALHTSWPRRTRFSGAERLQKLVELVGIEPATS